MKGQAKCKHPSSIKATSRLNTGIQSFSDTAKQENCVNTFNTYISSKTDASSGDIQRTGEISKVFYEKRCLAKLVTNRILPSRENPLSKKYRRCHTARNRM